MTRRKEKNTQQRQSNKPPKVLVIATERHGRIYQGTIYGCEPGAPLDELVDGTSNKAPVARIYTEFLDKAEKDPDSVNPDAVELMKSEIARREGREYTRATVGIDRDAKADTKGNDPLLAELLDLSFNKGDDSLVSRYKVLCEHLDAEPKQTKKEPMIDFIMSNADAYAELFGG